MSELLSVAEAAKATNDPEEKFALLKRYDELSAKLAEELASDQTKAKVDETVFHQPFDEIDEVEEPPNNVTSISSFASKKRA
ncbi:MULTISPECIES: hypothetical protein [Pseudoalteromonas]|uniref:hypothetical protein n=1 Tax=Pseudoalteromonas TaxID=53246 RepID=UPI00110BA36E|nr:MULTISPECIES: hypothetical protein [Pseudoalteromonas]MCG7545356.1 hypothetical protein [Pseudoalteromonas sp. MM17-2]